MSSLPCVVILAAGQGTRYRQQAGERSDKLLAPCLGNDGVVRPVLEQVLCNIPPQLTRRVLVTSPGRTAVIGLAEAYACQPILLQSEGMGESLAAGVRASADAPGWLILLGDMPFIRPETIERVAAGLLRSSVSVAQKGGRYGHPVAFANSHGSDLMNLRGDRGARSLFTGVSVEAIDVTDQGIFWDIDTPEALVHTPNN
ncbi:nucleotidyltransferase family protein [Ectopseudomonas mendocina]|uniref:Nucleotidyltransferase family protein n=1 Tax=Ectopseudomonas mendocina TaxID=300 RepID=A0ABZ2RT12_ECTME